MFVSSQRDANAARRFFEQAIGATKVMPAEITTDKAAVYPGVLEELLPAAWHPSEQYANNRVEADHGRLKARLRPVRGLGDVVAVAAYQQDLVELERPAHQVKVALGVPDVLLANLRPNSSTATTVWVLFRGPGRAFRGRGRTG